MATATGNYVCDNSSLANFKSWAQAISGAFSSFGWTQTGDTGQVNWSSIAAVPTNTYVYEIWKAADALASTMPIYVKVEYGFSATLPGIRMTVGTSSNGTGTITGQVVTSAPWNLTANFSNAGSTLYPCFFSGSAGEFRMWMWGVPTASPAFGLLFAIERSKDGSGNNTADYVTVAQTVQANAANFSWQQTITPSGVGNREGGIIGLGLTASSNTGLAFGTVAALPVFPVLGKAGNPMLGLMSVCATDVAINSTVTVASMYGSTHTYIACGGGQLSNLSVGRSGNPATMCVLMRYE